ncbi:DUF4369 domain-containing protein [Tamlana fucoidanivorans]|uniref:DUF4369 domain-containing protein n=1 Tax=Allotamlana fucoidanivorans TaxID=2583814 RepID=A0A5C4SIH5_9FLAO|nr:DUF4369 domain-containing protein [Tamlana fucoidanivorans]TNJ43543.1 DUF4369 domain-containing protein [Tamlana fucoidanivorans]
MKHIFILIMVLLAVACAKDQKDLVVKANIDGLKKGTLYLKKIEDTTLITVDSVSVNGQSLVELNSDLESPEVFFLYLDKNSKNEDRITFFADKGITEINTSLKNFVFDAQIKGSAQQKVLEDYQTMVSKINNRNLEIIKEKFEAYKTGDSLKLIKLEKEEKNALKRKYLFTVNYALTHKNSEVAPYLALSEIYNARLDLLNTINKSLTPEVKASKYGKELNQFIIEIKKEN